MELIKIREENGRQLVSARELYLGLGLNKTHWKRWAKQNIEDNEFFIENNDWVGFATMANGNETKDYAISLEFAKHIAMMARTEKSHEYRQYFIACERKLKEFNDPYKGLSPEVRAIIAIDTKVQKIEEDFNTFKSNLPLLNVDCKELQAEVRKKGIEVLGGYRSAAYNNKSLRSRTYQDIQYQIKREFGVNRYEAIKSRQVDKAIEIIRDYKVPYVLADEITMINNQVCFND